LSSLSIFYDDYLEATTSLTQGAVTEWQHVTNVGPERTTLIGFSQGSIMALASTQQTPETARCVVSIAGRFAHTPLRPSRTTIHLLHGQADAVIPYQYSVTASQQLAAVGTNATLDLIPTARHEINGEIADLLISRLKTHAAQRHDHVPI
jgi:phospholipase/carboxylesterase